jgi:hypothetical protein
MSAATTRDARAEQRRLVAAPMLAYAGAFVLSLSIYASGWSNAYPPLSWPLLAFVAATCAVCMLVAATALVHRPSRGDKPTWWSPARARVAVPLVYLVMALQFVHAQGIPLLMLALGVDYDYREFGIPTLHVLVFGIYNFLGVHFFALYLRAGDRRYLRAALGLLMLNVLIVNRGAVVQSMIAMGVLYFVRHRLSLRRVAAVLGSFAAAVYLFGLVGDSRMTAMGTDPAITITAIGDATDRYPTETIGSGPFWFYLYASSPLANWQLNVSTPRPSRAPTDWFVALEVLPDFIAKRVVPAEVFELSPHLVVDALTVSSAYGRAYFLWGWTGCALVFALLLLYYVVVRLVFRRSEYFASTLATLAAGAALMTYDNMLTFAGFVGPLLVAAFMRVFWVRRGAVSTR